ncbi:Cysteine proteinases superfamily protein [Raphanus sativus]|uniref:Ervatamin-B-like n=1 Tax=Raphanus sativus TaxID=3726 RepID=A0A6J0NWV0_RAPSA|nr:ervatamin-B-like [Raphanus sativus]KAJ4894807.1 Cysteine proteinases superfamily protein [Raphanus sativus]
MSSIVLMFVVLTILSMGLNVSQATSRVTFHEPLLADHHQQWMNRFSRVYNSELEKQMRFDMFKKNFKFIEEFNRKGDRTYKLGVNEFADWPEEDFIATHTGLRSTGGYSPSGFMYEVEPYQDWNVTDVAPHETKDWRNEGAVTPVRYQGLCGGCWAFSAVAAVEGVTKIAGGKLIPLSEQQLIDCDRGYNNGCGGGIMTEAFDYIVQNQGIASEEAYPFSEQAYPFLWTYEMCRFNARPAASIRGFQTVPSNNERALLEAVSRQPVSVSIDADGPGFMHYSGGVYDEPYCGTRVNHAVTFVGYGTSPEGIKYWLAKNSWGETWGENGYIRIRRDVDWPEGMCGVAQNAYYPIA